MTLVVLTNGKAQHRFAFGSDDTFACDEQVIPADWFADRWNRLVRRGWWDADAVPRVINLGSGPATPMSERYSGD